MLLAIDVKPEDIIFNKNGRIIVKVNYYAQFSIGAHLWVTDGETKKDFEKNKVLYAKTVFIGGKGGISAENNK